MRKRLIEKRTKSKKGSLGYTLTELLVVIGILAVLCAIAIPSIITISRALKFRQRNDYAKTIFLAAQANLSEMRSDGGLDMLQQLADGAHSVSGKSDFPSEVWESEYVFVNGDDSVLYSLVLPVNSVESSLRDQQVIIEYNPYSGNVYAVFYSEEDEDIYGPYAGEGLPRNDLAARKDMMLGYYDGSGLANQELDLQQTKAELEYVNGEEGVLEVKVPVPAKYYSDLNSFADGLSVTLTITGDTSGNSITVPIKTAEEANPGAVDDADESNGGVSNMAFTSGGQNAADDAQGSTDITLEAETGEVAWHPEDGNKIVIEYPLDSLATGKSFADKAITDPTITSLTLVKNESGFAILPGENVTVTAVVSFTAESTLVEIESGILPGINPLFAYLEPSATAGKYVLAISNGRNLQNLNILAPSVARNVETVVFQDDVNWNDTVSYYNNKYGKTVGSDKIYTSTQEAPARCLPYFVPISNDNLFGSAYFTNGNDGSPTLEYSHDVDTSNGTLRPVDHADIVGNDYHVIGLNIDATRYEAETAFTLSDGYYVSNNYSYVDANNVKRDVVNHQQVNYNFTGLFAYANTYIDGLNIVNPSVKGHPFSADAVPATGSLLGASGYNSLVTNCGVYIDKSDKDYRSFNFNPQPYDVDADQTWYGVSGQGSVGGLVGYAKSHRTASGDLTDNTSELAFSYCFAAVPVSGDMRGSTNVRYGYTNGVGGFIGNSELTNFYSCYASGKVYATGCYVREASHRQSEMAGGVIQGIIENALPSTVLINNILEYDGYYSTGAGGFVGTSHGTRYTNCFTTGDVDGYSAGNTENPEAGVGGFVGIMCFDERFTYSVAGAAGRTIQQLTVFDSCYSTGKATIIFKPTGSSVETELEKENFSGANARVFKYDGTIYADYYKLLAPYYARTGNVPSYPTSYENNDPLKNGSFYIYKDSYYLSRNYDASAAINDDSNECATVISYDILTNLAFNHINAGSRTDRNDSWLDQRVSDIGKYHVGHVHDWISGIFPGATIIDLSPTYEGFFGNRLVSRLFYGEDNYWEDVLWDVYIGRLQEGFPGQDWKTAITANTHPYTMNSGAYPFSKLDGMPYYGDWPTQPLASGLAYYEEYLTNGSDKISQGFYFDSENTATLMDSSEMEGYTLVSDGYAILSVSRNDRISVQVGENPNIYSLTRMATNYYYSPGGESASNTYAVFPLTKQIMDAAAAQVTQEHFYVKLTVKVLSDNAADKEANYVLYFNPNVAKSNINPASGKVASEPDSIPERISIRTARQLAALSNTSASWGAAYGAEENVRPYRYVQELDIDFDDYTASGYVKVDAAQICETIAQAGPIGTKDNPFNASYNGYNGVTSRTSVTRDMDSDSEPAAQTAPALFGVIGETGSVENLIVNAGLEGKTMAMGPSKTTETTASITSIGIVANQVNGTLDNVELRLAGSVTLIAPENGGLAVGAVGSTGTLTGVDVTSGSIALVHADNAGGVVGTVEAGAAVSGCGVAFTDTLMLKGTHCGGFVGSCSGSAQEVTVELTKGMTVESDGFAGGFAGVISGTGDAPIMVSNCSVKLGNTTVNNNSTATESAPAGSVLGGFAGSAENALLSANSVELSGSQKAAAAAGFVGTASGLTVQNSSAEISGTIAGDEFAAGFAVSMLSGSKFTACNAVISGGITAPHAAGYAVTVDGAIESCFVTMNGAGISGTVAAAGFAETVSTIGTVYGTGGSGVVGLGSITAPTAAGFAVTVSGTVTGSRVTPAYSQSKKAYSETNYTYLNITAADAAGTATAAGFAITVDNGASVLNCDALGTITGTTVSCFADTNAGTIDGCMANVMVPGDCSFVRNNSGTVCFSYGWFGDGHTIGDGLTTTALTSFDVGGTCYSSYFADLDVWGGEGVNSIVLYTSAGERKEMDTLTLKASIGDLNTSGKSWFAGEKFAAYPFSGSLLRDNATYPFPMHRPHSGNWVGTPQYAYGVVYYEKNVDGKLKYHVVDLSDPMVTMDRKKLSIDGEFTGDGQIIETGYAVFCKNVSNLSVKDADGNEISDGIGQERTDLAAIAEAINKKAVVNYQIYALNAKGQLLIGGADVHVTTPSEGEPDTATIRGIPVVTWYADAIDVTDNTYQIRTAEQFDNIGKMTATFQQTHDITLEYKTDGSCIVDAFTGTYFGKLDEVQYSLSAEKLSGLIGEVRGTIANMDLRVTSANGSLFGTVTGTLQDSVISVNSTSYSVINRVSGSVSGNTIRVSKADISGESFGVAVCEIIEGGTLSDNHIFAAVNMSGTAASTVGGIASVNAGTISGGSVNVAFNASGDTVIGGIAGVNTGKISGDTNKALEADVTVTYTQTDKDNAVIGGLVGRMDAGSISNVNVSGNIALTDERYAFSSYTVGGAIGRDNVKDNAEAAYATVESSVTVDARWATNSPTEGCQNMGHGPVGMFVGYVGIGRFDSCSSIAENSTYQFLGQITAIPAVLDSSNGKNWYRHTNSLETTEYTENKSAVTVPDGKDGPTYVRDLFAENNGFEALSENYQYQRCNAILNNCTFVHGGESYTQVIQPTEYYFQGESQLLENQYQRVNAVLGYDADSQVSYNELYPGNADNQVHDTEWYFDQNGDIKVYVKVEQTGIFFIRYKYYLCNFDGTETYYTFSDIWDRTDTIKNKGTNLTLYKRATTLENGEYLITDSFGKYMLNSAGNAELVPDMLDPNTLPLWSVNGHDWECGGHHLYLVNGGIWVESDTSTIYVSEFENGFSLLGDGTGAQYLSFAGDKFTTTTGQSVIRIWQLEKGADVYRCTFTRNSENLICLTLDGNKKVKTLTAIAAASSIEEPLTAGAGEDAQPSSDETVGGEGGTQEG